MGLITEVDKIERKLQYSKLLWLKTLTWTSIRVFFGQIPIQWFTDATSRALHMKLALAISLRKTIKLTFDILELRPVFKCVLNKAHHRNIFWPWKVNWASPWGLRVLDWFQQMANCFCFITHLFVLQRIHICG